MNKKLLYALIGVSIVAAITYLVKQNSAENLDTAKGTPIVEEGLYEESINAITFENKTGSFSVSKTETLWKIDALNFPADTNKLFTLLNQLNTEKIIETVTSNPDSFEKFGFRENGTQSDLRILFEKDGKDVASILIGNTRSGGGQYIKRGKSESIFLITNSLSFPDNEEALIKKIIFSIDLDRISAIKIDTKTLKTTLTPTQSDSSDDAAIRFVMPDNGDYPDKNKMDALITLYNPLTFDTLHTAFPDGLGEKHAVGALTMSLKEGGSVRTRVFQKNVDKKKNYYFALEIIGTTDTQLNRLMRSLEGKLFQITESNAKKLLIE